MISIGIARIGGPDQLCEVPTIDRQPAAAEVRVVHRACGVNFIDTYHRSGLYSIPLPSPLGVEAAGIIDAVGPGVDHLAVGDRVAYVTAKPGSYSTSRVVPAVTVVRLPPDIDFARGAAMMLKGLTVQYLLRRTRPQRDLVRGDFVLWHAAAGGVGLIACQWARALGLQLIATAGSDDKCQLALRHGAAHAINYLSQDVVGRVRELTDGRGVIVAYDSVGRDTWEITLGCMAPLGLVVSFGNASGPVPPIQLSTLASHGSLHVTRPTLFTHLAERAAVEAMTQELFAIVASGEVVIGPPREYPLADAARAHRDLEARTTTGALVLLPPPP